VKIAEVHFCAKMNLVSFHYFSGGDKEKLKLKKAEMKQIETRELEYKINMSWFIISC